MTRIRYFDASAIVKLVVDEPESAALRTYAKAAEVASTSLIGVVEARRAATRRGSVPMDELVFVLGGFEVVELDRAVADDAALIPPVTLGSLDAIHVASARQLGADLEALVSYDRRMIEAATEAGLPVASPGAASGRPTRRVSSRGR